MVCQWLQKKMRKSMNRKYKKINPKVIFNSLIVISIVISTCFLAVGYAAINPIALDIEGVGIAKVQTGVFITDVVYSADVEADTANSKINFYSGTMLDSKVVLGNNSNSTLTYKVTLYNNSNNDRLFIDTITDMADTTLYSNSDIEYSLNGLEEYVTTIGANKTIDFTITFSFKAGADISNNVLISKLDFRFKEAPKLLLSNNTQTYTLNNVYPDYTPQEYKFTVSNYDENAINNVPMSYSFETIINKPLTAKIYDETGNLITGNITIPGDGTTKIERVYIMKIIWDNSNASSNLKYNSADYASKTYECKVTLNAVPTDTSYKDYSIAQQFNVNISTAPFYFNSSIENATVSILNNVGTFKMTMNNYNSSTKYNVYDTKYQVSIADNADFTFSITNEQTTNGIVTKTLSGMSAKDNELEINLNADISNLDVTENLTLKISSTKPYVKEITIPVTVNLHAVTVTLNANSGTVSPATIVVYNGKTYSNLPTPTKSGYKFNGWYSAASGGTEYKTTTKVTTTNATQTLYAQWTSRLLAHHVSVGDYVNYPVNYTNVASNSDYVAQYTGWRVLSIDGTGDNQYVRLISAGVPLTYRHASATGAGATSVTKLTTGFFSTAITTSTNYTYQSCGFKDVSGNAITTIAQLKTLFTNEYTQISSGVPKVQSITKKDLDAVWGKTTVNAEDVSSNDLLAVPSTTASMYTSYFLAEAYGNYVWASYSSGCVVYTYTKHGVRPVVTLKTTVETSGQQNGVWQLD